MTESAAITPSGFVAVLLAANSTGVVLAATVAASDAVEAPSLDAVIVASPDVLDSVDALEPLASAEVVAGVPAALEVGGAGTAEVLDMLAEAETPVELELGELDVVTAQPASNTKDVSAPATAARKRNMANAP